MMTFILIATLVSITFLVIKARISRSDWDDIWRDDE